MEIGGSGARGRNCIRDRAMVLMMGIGMVRSGAEIPLLHRSIQQEYEAELRLFSRCFLRWRGEGAKKIKQGGTVGEKEYY